MVAKGLQYAPSKGIPEFLSEIKTLRHNYHGLSNLEDQIDVCVSVGSQNGLEMLLSSLINPSDGILLDEPCYPGTKAILGPLGANMIGVETDSDGMNLKDLIKKINFAKEKNINLKVRFILIVIRYLQVNSVRMDQLEWISDSTVGSQLRAEYARPYPIGRSIFSMYSIPLISKICQRVSKIFVE